MKYTVYTDGSCKGNPGPGAWVYVIIPEEGVPWTAGCGKENTTNNEMELMALREALFSVYSDILADSFHSVGDHVEVTVYSDSQYVVKGINEYLNRWVEDGSLDKRPNAGIWKDIKKMKDILSVKAIHIKAHAGSKLNNLVDSVAQFLASAVR